MLHSYRVQSNDGQISFTCQTTRSSPCKAGTSNSFTRCNPGASLPLTYLLHQRRKPQLATWYGSRSRSEEGYKLLTQLFEFDPMKRITAKQAIMHEYFTSEQPKPMRKWVSDRGRASPALGLLTLSSTAPSRGLSMCTHLDA